MNRSRTFKRCATRIVGRFERLEDRLMMAFDPTGAEQELLEHVNRMRMDPQGELGVLFSSISPLTARDPDANSSIQYFGDPSSTEIQADWPGLVAVAPLAWNESLYNTAAAHNAAMIAADTQSHQVAGEPAFATRFQNAGYTDYAWISENIFAFAESVFGTHSAFAIDWGVADRGHRTNLMSASVREAGFCITPESNSGTSVGPLVVTEDFGNRYGLGDSYLLGVVYQDTDANSRYTAGEGLAGVQITVAGAAGTFTATTMSAGGYQVQAPAGTYTVTASGGGLAAPIVTTGVAVGSDNKKVDFLASPARPTTVGIYDPTESRFYLRFSNTQGPAQKSFLFGASGWEPVAGDWNGDGRDTIGLFQREAAQFYLRNTNDLGGADISFGYGVPGSDQVLLMGDWNGDGIDTIGLFRPDASLFELRNSNSMGMSDLAFGFGAPGAGWMPLVGDWNGDGTDTVGLYDPTTGMFYMRNSHTTGMADVAFAFGTPNNGWQPLVGDWNADGVETAGFYQPGDASHFYLRNTLDIGMSDVDFGLGFAGVTPIVGDWLGPTGTPLMTGGGLIESALQPTLDEASVQSILQTGLARWAEIGHAIGPVEVVIADLPGAMLGAAQDGVIYLDVNAAGHGWFVDPTPSTDEEFAHLAGRDGLCALDPRAIDRIDLSTVIQHELGHLAGLKDLDATLDALMSAALPSGVRRLPTTAESDAMLGG